MYGNLFMMVLYTAKFRIHSGSKKWTNNKTNKRNTVPNFKFVSTERNIFLLFCKDYKIYYCNLNCLKYYCENTSLFIVEGVKFNFKDYDLFRTWLYGL